MCQLFQACRLCFNMIGIRFSPTVAIIDSQTAKGAQKGDLGCHHGPEHRQDEQRRSTRDPADPMPVVERIFADGGYAGEKMALVVCQTGAWKLEIVRNDPHHAPSPCCCKSLVMNPNFSDGLLEPVSECLRQRAARIYPPASTNESVALSAAAWYGGSTTSVRRATSGI
jgi:hypothetical protein